MLVRKNKPQTFRLSSRDVWRLRRYPLEQIVRFVVIRYVRWIVSNTAAESASVGELLDALENLEATPMAACRSAARELLEERPWA